MTLRPIVFALAITATAVVADTVTLPNSFSNNTQADADAVQANFTALVDESNENDGRIAALENTLATDAPRQNMGVGIDALSNNATGIFNTAAGIGPLTSNTSGDYNTAVGAAAMARNTQGNENTATGAEALVFNTIGNRNTATGAAALFNNAEGSNNTAIGYYALLDNTSGDENIAVGSNALASNLTGNQNIAIGIDALRSNTGSFNAALGFLALADNTDGAINLALGYRALLGNTSGSQNVAAGQDALRGNTSGNGNLALGRGALSSNVTGSENIAIGNLAGPTFAATALSNTIAIGNGAEVSASNTIRLGNGQITSIFTQVDLSITSDARLKESIEPIEHGLALIKDLNPVSYHRINNSDGNDIEMGLLAQEIAPVLDRHGLSASGMVNEPAGDGYMSVRYNDLIAPMIRAIQELDSQNADRQDDVNQQITELNNALVAQQGELLALVRNQQAQIARLETMILNEQVTAR